MKVVKNASGYDVVNESNKLIYASVYHNKKHNSYQVIDHKNTIDFSNEIIATDYALKTAERNLRKIDLLV